MPLPGTNADGVIRAVYVEDSIILTEQAIQSIAPNALVIIGTARPFSETVEGKSTVLPYWKLMIWMN